MSTALTIFTIDEDIDYPKVNFIVLCVIIVLIWNLYRSKALLVVFLETDTTRPTYDRRHMIGEQYENTLNHLSAKLAKKKHVPDTYMASYDPVEKYWHLVGKSVSVPSYLSRRINTLCHDIPVGPHLNLDIVRELLIQKNDVVKLRIHHVVSQLKINSSAPLSLRTEPIKNHFIDLKYNIWIIPIRVEGCPSHIHATAALHTANDKLSLWLELSLTRTVSVSNCLWLELSLTFFFIKQVWAHPLEPK